MRALWRELARRHRGLAAAGALNLAAALAFVLTAPFDDLQVTGVDRFYKPIKFTLSVGIYLWTVAWFLPYLRVPRWLGSGAGWVVALTMVAENTLIVLQALRGTTSHFNRATAFDSGLFTWMGILIAVNSLVLALLLALFLLRPAAAPRAWLWGIRLGIAILLLASAQGLLMIQADAHSVGAPDGGPGLPFLDWSTRAGDLRPSHMLGLHALQIVPLFAFFASRRRGWSEAAQVAAVFAFALLYAGLGFLLFLQASRGLPVLPLAG